MRNIRFWTPEELARERTQTRSVQHKLSMDYATWPASKVAILVGLYPQTTNRLIARVLSMKPHQIDSKAFRLGLRKTPEFKLFFALKTAFKKGSIPSNKGKDCKHYQSEKSRATQFKKGQLPRNTLYDGAITIRPDKRGVNRRFIRIAMGKWIHYSVHIWEQANGKVPRGMCVRHKSTDWLDDSLDNLMLVSQKENRILNSGSTTLSDAFVATTIYTKKHPELKAAVLANKDLIEIKRLQLQLNRTIKQTQHDNSSSPDHRKQG
jgi:hypothetical protein